MTDYRKFNSIAPSPPSLGVNATAADAPAPVLAAVATNPSVSRFLAKVADPNDRGCTLWTGSLNRGNGYGDFWLDGSTVAAHRASWQLFVGPIPEGLCVLHECDVRSCVNPRHLFLGTTQDNVDDMVSKDRHRKGPESTAHLLLVDRRGEKCSRAKLTEAQAKVILARHLKGESPSALAREFGLRRTTISSLVNGSTWMHIPRPHSPVATLSSSAVPSAGSQETVAASAGLQVVTVSTNSDPAFSSLPFGAPVNCAEASVSALFSSLDPGPCGFDFEAEVSALEAEWLRDGIIMNARTFCVSVISDSISSE